jgi:quercetin dioxygenase-like cupin family protein
MFMPELSKLILQPWANASIEEQQTILYVDHRPRTQHLAHSPATGEGLVSNGRMGVDLIQLSAGRGFQPHTHPGDHLLIVIGGRGTLTYDGVIYPTQAGQVYCIEGQVPHAVGAITDHVILAVGSPHKAVDDPERMIPVEYQAIVAATASVTCLICQRTTWLPEHMHDRGCPHCPCLVCQPET